MARYALVVVAAVLLIAADHAKESAKKDLKKLDGSWVLKSGVDDGKELPPKALESARLTFAGDKHTVEMGGKTYKGTHVVDAEKKPKTIDITDTDGPFKGKTVLGIYEID